MSEIENQEEGLGYWDVFPRLIRVSCAIEEQSIPLSIRGPISAPVFESCNPGVADVDELGNVLCGLVPGAAVIMVYPSYDKSSVRHVQVEVYGQPSGEVEE